MWRLLAKGTLRIAQGWLRKALRETSSEYIHTHPHTDMYTVAYRRRGPDATRLPKRERCACKAGLFAPSRCDVKAPKQLRRRNLGGGGGGAPAPERPTRAWPCTWSRLKGTGRRRQEEGATMRWRSCACLAERRMRDCECNWYLHSAPPELCLVADWPTMASHIPRRRGPSKHDPRSTPTHCEGEEAVRTSLQVGARPSVAHVPRLHRRFMPSCSV